MSRYAEQTQVSSSKSRDDIERTLSRYGAHEFAYAWDGGRAMIQFSLEERRVRFVLPLPDRQSADFTETPTGKPRSASAAEAQYDQAVRQRWRALHLVIKAKLEAVESGITEFDEEFLAHIVLPNGSTVGDSTLPAVKGMCEVGKMRPLLGITAGDDSA